MAVIAHDPEVHAVPAAIAFGIGAERGNGVIHRAQGGAHGRGVVTIRVGRLVGASEGAEGERGAVARDAVGSFCAEFAVDLVPARNITAEVGAEEREQETCGAAASLGGEEAAIEAGERADIPTRAVKDRVGVRGDIVVDAEAADSHVASRAVRPGAGLAGPVEPAQCGEADRPRVTAVQKWGIGRPGYRWEHRGNRVRAPLAPHPGNCGEFARISSGGEGVRTGPVGQQDHDTGGARVAESHD